jgi:glutathione synthase/RimK-type ligase-like ATP-grasp enzyme
MRFLGVYRERMFSPGRVLDDAAIMDETLAVLTEAGHETYVVKAEELDGASDNADCVLTMGQSNRALEILDRSKGRGVRIVNTVTSIRLCSRVIFIRLLARAGLPQPHGKITTPEEARRDVAFDASKEYWLKRGDVHKIEPDDVVRVASHEELEAALDHFSRRRISPIVVQEHVQGPVVKFYGVSAGLATASPYFAAFPEGGDVEITDDLAELRKVAVKAAAATGLEVYGGDAVVTPEGEAVLIDLNAWPSFSRCRGMAAQRIAGYVAGTESPVRFGISRLG